MARQFTKGIDLYEAQMKRFEDMRQTVRALHRGISEAAKQDALELTSGGVSKQTLARLGHPFGRNAGSYSEIAGHKLHLAKMRGASRARLARQGLGTVMPLLPINKQSHRLHDSIRLVPRAMFGASQAFGVESVGVDYARYILSPSGTVRMVGRGIQIEIRKRWKARNKALIDYARRTHIR